MDAGVEAREVGAACMALSHVERRAAVPEADDGSRGLAVASIAAEEGGPGAGGDGSDGDGIGEQEQEQHGHRGAAAAVATEPPRRSSSETTDNVSDKDPRLRRRNRRTAMSSRK